MPFPPIAAGEIQRISDLVDARQSEIRAVGDTDGYVVVFMADTPGMTEAGVAPESDRRAFDGIPDIVWHEYSRDGGSVRKIAYGTMVKDGTGEHKVVFGPDFVPEGNGADSLMGNEYDFDGDQKQDLKYGNFSKGTEENVDAEGNPTPGHVTDGSEKVYNLDVIGHISVDPSDIKKPTVGLDHMDVNGDGLYDTYFCCSQWYIRTINGETLKTFKMP